MRRFLMIALCALTAGCARPDAADYDTHQRFRTQVEERELSATINAGGLGPAETAALRNLARDYLRRPAAPIRVSGADAEAVKQVLSRAGVGEDQISAKFVDGPNVIAAPVWHAKVPECGNWEEDITVDARNQNTWNFGCSVARNIGLMVSDPADLVRSREATGRDANRASDVLGKYGQGKATSAAAEAGAADSLSTVGK